MTAGAGWRVTAGDRAALLRKYRVLAGWRLARDDENAQGDRADRAGLKALAEEFPGALRELDLLGLPEIERRIDRLARRPGGDQNPESDRWIAWILAYHALMRAALATKRALGRRAHPSATSLRDLARRATSIAGVRIDESFVHTVVRPPGGRLAIVVLRAVAQRFNVTPTLVSATLFPARRPAPYQLPPSTP